MTPKQTFLRIKSWWVSLPWKHKRVALTLVVISPVVWYLYADTACEAHNILKVSVLHYWLNKGVSVGIAVLIPCLVLLISSIFSKDKNLNKRYWLVYFAALLFGTGYLITFLPLILFCR